MARLLVAIAVTAAATIWVGTAAADPVKNPHVSPLTITCEGGISGIAYPTGSAGHLSGSTTVGVLKGESGPNGTFFVAGWDASELTACTAPEAVGFTFYVLITPRKG